MKNDAYGNRSRLRRRLDREDTIRVGRFLDTLDWRGSDHGFYPSSGSEREYAHCHHHLCKRSEKQYFPEEFK